MKKRNVWLLLLTCTLYGGAAWANDLGTILGGRSDQFKRPCRASPSRCPPITLPTPTTAPSGGISPATSRMSRGANMACSGPCFARVLSSR
ncbi:hypothetical protein LMCDFJHI_00883 [Aeromonas salmonicida]